jgi:hypothetical protein
MKNKNLILIGIFLLVGVLLNGLISAESYSRSNVNYGLFDSYVQDNSYGSYRNRCEAGQDFILQIAPFGCTPAVVRSDLLEEQNVPIFCKIAATKINPLIDVKAIESISFSGKYSKEISGVGFHPSKAALGVRESINSPILDNIGYAVIILKKQKNESSMPDFVYGNLTARLRYDIQNAFGIGKASFYVPYLENNKWKQEKERYSFWDGRGYLKAEEIGTNYVAISIYNDLNKISTVRLNKGETSNEIFMPGIDCQANLKLKLDGLEKPDTMVRLDINGEKVQVIEEERFLDNKCVVKKIEPYGINQKVILKCDEDENSGLWGRDFPLEIKPKINITINGEEKIVGIGEKLYSLDSNGVKNIYLGYIGRDLEGDFFIVPVVSEAQSKNQFLNLSVSKDLYTFMKSYEFEIKNSGILNELNKLAGVASIFANSINSFSSFLITGSYPVKIIYKEGVQLSFDQKLKKDKFSEAFILASASDKVTDYFRDNDFKIGDIPEIKFNGFVGASDFELIGDSKINYDNAMQDYENVIKNYGDEKFKEIGDGAEKYVVTYSEQALIEKINLANRANQKKIMQDLCKQFNEKYPDSKNRLSVCLSDYKISSSTIFSKDVSINGRSNAITFEGIYEPSIEDYNVEIMIDNAEKNYNGLKIIGKKGQIYLSNSEFILLKELNDDYAIFDVSGVTPSTIKKVIYNSQSLKFEINEPLIIGEKKYRITLRKINLKKFAKVSVIPNINNAGTTAEFGFKIGIEKREIQLSPEKTQERIDSLNKTIKEWEDKSERLGKVVKGLKGACLATGAGLMVKNFLANTDGKAIARQEVMRGEDGIYEECAKLKKEGKFTSVEECMLDDDIVKKIEERVNKMHGLMQAQNTEFELIQKDCDYTEFLTEKHFNSDCINENYFKETKKELKDIGAITCGDKELTGEEVNAFFDNIEVDKLSTNELKDLIRNKRARDESSLISLADTRLKMTFCDVWENNQEEIKRKGLVEKFGTKSVRYGKDPNKKTQKFSIAETTSWENVKDKFLNFPFEIKKETYVEIYGDVSDGGKAYLLVLNDDFIVTDTYLIGVLDNKTKKYPLTKEGNSNLHNIEFKKIDVLNYKNPYDNPELKYYETEPNKGLPAVVPFDCTNGWYVYAQQVTGALGSLKAYDDSGAARNYYICNVGENKREEAMGGDDDCQMINRNLEGKNLFSLNPTEAGSLIRNAERAILQASKLRARDSKLSGHVKIGTCNAKVGSPVADIPDMQCQDFMSPKDCQLLFNVCDPVICPSSRCDFGGSYPVKDVIQSGIVGSLLLCLPNFNEGIYIPVCLTGIKAGIDGLLSVYHSYGDCLQESLDSGEMVGVCDEIHSIYMCEFLWKQALPIADIVIPKMFEMVLGQNIKGGGEYLGVSSAWNTASKSVDYFTTYYAQNSFAAFKSRTTEEVGGEVCKNFASGVYPEGGNLLDKLTQPDSPPQFHGRFDEIPFTTATVPPVSHYKVFYHIYSGKDSRAYYQVYLKGSSGGSYYQDTGYHKVIASGYIKTGGYASETKDFTAPSGYKELCIRVNEQEECGFQQATTSYAVNYVKDKYMEEIASEKNIKSEKECISGSASAYSLLQPNLQSAGEDLIDPKIYERGIIRICASENPGKNKDILRWAEVGNCGNSNIKCWLDKESVENVIRDRDIEDQTLSELEKIQKDIFDKEGIYEKLTNEKKVEIEGKGALNRISVITQLIPKVLLNFEKAWLFLKRGNAYGELVKNDNQKIQNNIEEEKTNGEPVNEAKDKEISLIIKERDLNEAEFKKIVRDAGFSHCEDYTKLIIDASNEYSISDPLFLMALMMQESGCKSDAISVDRSSHGLMQISSWEMCKNELELKSVENIKGQGNINKNIKCGAIILKKKYSNNKKRYNCEYFESGNQNEKAIDKTYTGWVYALRGYNGWSCAGYSDGGSEIFADQDYVDNVIEKYNKLLEAGGFKEIDIYGGSNLGLIIENSLSKCEIDDFFWVTKDFEVLDNFSPKTSPGNIYIGIETKTFDFCKNYFVKIYENRVLGGKVYEFEIDKSKFKEKSNNFYVSENVPYEVSLIKKNFLNYDPNYYKFEIVFPNKEMMWQSLELEVDNIYSF